MRSFLLVLCLILIIPISEILPQGNTTAAINGYITDSDGMFLVGVTIVVIHEPTGTRMGCISNKNGRYNLPGLKVGGPYTITASMVGFEKATKKNIYLGVDQNSRIDFKIKESGVKTGEVRVVGDVNDIITSSRTGASQNVTNKEITRLPTISRSIHDYSRLSPLIVSSTSEGSNVGGRNSRYNNIQVDGAILSDAFGLAASGTPGGQADAQPISLVVIQEFQVAIAPFDVRQGGFTGGLINAITKSGTNQFEGSLYAYGRNQKLMGTSPDPRRLSATDFHDYQYGGLISGPIIENKLFFLFNAEVRERRDPFVLGINDTNYSNNFAVPIDSLKKIQQIAEYKWSLTPGNYDPYTRPTQDYKLFLRLDYNISDAHRLSLRHNLVSGLQGNDMTRSIRTFSFSSQEYLFRSMQNQTVAQLNSIFGSSVANELRLSMTIVNDDRDAQSTKPFPEITIFNLGADRKEKIS